MLNVLFQSIRDVESPFLIQNMQSFVQNPRVVMVAIILLALLAENQRLTLLLPFLCCRHQIEYEN